MIEGAIRYSLTRFKSDDIETTLSAFYEMGGGTSRVVSLQGKRDLVKLCK